ncbi:transposable element Tc1 transposase [Trichonephila clavipes]|nr:transposable element Tc1 transposase [Trichonephila clavipes]
MLVYGNRRTISASSICRCLLHRGLPARVSLYRIPLTANHQWHSLTWAHERAWQADWHQVNFSDESCFNLWDPDGHICAGLYASEHCLPECIIKWHSGLTPGVMVSGAISYYGRSNLLRVEDNLNSNRYVHEVLHPEVVPFCQGIRGAIFQQDNSCPHVAKTVRNSCSALHMQLLPWPAYLPDMRPIEHVWVWLVGESLMIRVMQFQKMNFCCAYKQYRILFHKQTFKICLTPCPAV